MFYSEGLQQHRIHTVNPTGPVGMHGVVRKGDHLLEVRTDETKTSIINPFLPETSSIDE